MSPVSQLVFNGILAGSLLSLVAVAFGITYLTSRFFDFSLPAFVAVGGYAALAMTSFLPPPAALVLATLAAGAVGLMRDTLVYGPLRGKAASPLLFLISSLGLYAVMQNLVSLAFGEWTRSFRWWRVSPGWRVLGARITEAQVWVLLLCWIAVGALVWIWHRTRMGRRMRAVGQSPELAASVGISAERSHRLATMLSASAAGLAGILLGLDVDLNPTMGLRPFLIAVGAVLVGGSQLAVGVAVALVIGILLNVGTLLVPTLWLDAALFSVLFVFLVARTPPAWLRFR